MSRWVRAYACRRSRNRSLDVLAQNSPRISTLHIVETVNRFVVSAVLPRIENRVETKTPEKHSVSKAKVRWPHILCGLLYETLNFSISV
jgi:hypothetical protein